MERERERGARHDTRDSFNYTNFLTKRTGSSIRNLNELFSVPSSFPFSFFLPVIITHDQIFPSPSFPSFLFFLSISLRPPRFRLSAWERAYEWGASLRDVTFRVGGWGQE